MRTATCVLSVVVLILIATQNAIGEDILFKDDFKGGLSDKWKVVGLKKTDYRVRKGALEMRVQPGKLTRKTPMVKVLLPFTSADTVAASVKVTVLDKFTHDHEFAGLFLLDESGLEFAATKERIDGKLVFAPSNQFKDKPIGEGDPGKERTQIHRRNEGSRTAANPCRSRRHVISSRSLRKRQVSELFSSAIRKEKKERGFCLIAAGALTARRIGSVLRIFASSSHAQSRVRLR